MPDTAAPFPLTMDDVNRVIARDALRRLSESVENWALKDGDLAFVAGHIALAAHNVESIVAKAREADAIGTSPGNADGSSLRPHTEEPAP